MDLGFADINAVVEILPLPKVFIYSLWLFYICVSPNPHSQMAGYLTGRNFYSS